MNRVSFRSASWLAVALFAAASCTVPPADPLETAPHIKAFTASAHRVNRGDAVTLHWDTENADEVKIDELRLGTVSGVSGATGDVQVNVNQDSLYVLRVRNTRGASDSAVVSITVGEAGKLVFAAVPPDVAYGASSTLAWTAPGATAVTLTGDDGSTIDVHGQTESGSVVVSPAKTTVYTLAVGTLNATATVTVSPSVVSFSNDALTVDGGSSDITLRWKTVGGARLQITSPGRGLLLDTTDAARVADGTLADPLPQVIDPSQIFTYDLTVSTDSASSTRRVQVSFAGQPVVVSFTAPKYTRDPAAPARPDGGTVATTFALSWETRSADTLSISANGTEIYRAPRESVQAGSLSLPNPAADTHYELRATRDRGSEVVAGLDVDVVGVPTLSVTATPTTVNGGEPTELQWAGTNLRTIEVVENGYGTLHSDTGVLDMGSFSVAPGGPTTYTVIGTNGLGDRIEAPASITVTNPIVLTLSDTGVLRAGQTYTATFTVPNQPSATITGLPHAQVDARPASTSTLR